MHEDCFYILFQPTPEVWCLSKYIYSTSLNFPTGIKYKGVGRMVMEKTRPKIPP